MPVLLAEKVCEEALLSICRHINLKSMLGFGKLPFFVSYSLYAIWIIIPLCYHNVFCSFQEKNKILAIAGNHACLNMYLHSPLMTMKVYTERRSIGIKWNQNPTPLPTDHSNTYIVQILWGIAHSSVKMDIHFD